MLRGPSLLPRKHRGRRLLSPLATAMVLPSTCNSHPRLLPPQRHPPSFALRHALRPAGAVLSDYSGGASRVALLEFVGAGEGNNIFRATLRTTRSTRYSSSCDPASTGGHRVLGEVWRA
ncbi:hypothetical protein PVAP13_3KG366900 [Panicum virgatum]|uniref:Uncharacterized protein n=1 Tax=Panicum virgatum TaxID=38727 RepID=A0A8T0UWW8_PANVG|nr:hypothetical protein PVAP13_3KG366900 [Panicum virgatum]